MEYSRSVWFEEVDRGLIKLIENTVRYKDDKGNIHKVIPIFPKADMDLTSISLPTVIIKKRSHRFDLNRYDSSDIILDIDKDLAIARVESGAKPYTLDYQLEFLAQYQEDMNFMMRTWCNSVTKRFLLEVIDTSGEERKCYMLQTSPQVTLNVSNSGENILYRTVVTYDIRVELDEGTIKEIDVASDINFDYK